MEKNISRRIRFEQALKLGDEFGVTRQELTKRVLKKEKYEVYTLTDHLCIVKALVRRTTTRYFHNYYLYSDNKSHIDSILSRRYLNVLSNWGIRPGNFREMFF